MLIGIYIITNLINNKVYIGQSDNINKRFKDHKYALNGNYHNNNHLQNAWNKYGENNFSFNLIKCCKIPYLNRFEKLYINKYKSDDRRYGYNKTKGGDNPPIQYGEKNNNYRDDVHIYDNDICQKYTKGMSYYALSNEYNCNPITIKKILLKNNIPIRNIQEANKRQDVWEKQKSVCNYYLKGNCLLDTANNFDTSVSVIQNILENNNIPTRSNSEILKGKHNSKRTEFKKGMIPHNKGKSLFELNGGIEYIINCIKNDMNRDEIAKDLGYKNFGMVNNYLRKNHDCSYTELCIELGKKYGDEGYYRVNKINRNNKQGYSYLYHPKKGKIIERLSLTKLEEAVKEKGYEWKKL